MTDTLRQLALERLEREVRPIRARRDVDAVREAAGIQTPASLAAWAALAPAAREAVIRADVAAGLLQEAS